MRKFFIQISCRNELGRLVPDLFLCFKKALNEVKASGYQLSFNILQKPVIFQLDQKPSED